MVKLVVPSASTIAKKWAEEAPKRSVYYESETIGKGSVWESGASGAADTFKSAVAAADIGKRFKGGVKGKSGKFDRKVKDVGVSRFGPGITAAQTDMESGMGPVVTDIAAVDVPVRKPRGDAGNWDRSRKVGEHLNKQRLARLAAGSPA